MQEFKNWRKEQQVVSELTEQKVTQDQFIEMCVRYFGATLRGNMTTIREFWETNLLEAADTSRYAVEVNYRTTTSEALEGFAKICLGYVSAALKNHGYHTRHVFTEKPLRLLVSSRAWDNGELTGCVTWNHEHNCFIISKGFFNKERKTISLQNSKKCAGDSAAEIAKELNNMMHSFKGQPSRHVEKLKPVPLKRGPRG